jgi:hypothetical protein
MKRRELYIALFICSVIVAIAAAFAFASPDGLDWVSKGLGFASSNEEAAALAPIGSYGVPDSGHSFLSTFVTAVLGIAAVFIIVMLAGRIIQARRRQITQRT